MHSTPKILMALLAATVAARAQKVPPGLSAKLASDPVIDIGKAPLKNVTSCVQQVNFIKLDSDKAGVWTVCMTGCRVATSYGGDRRRMAVLIGKYDTARRSLTMTTQANALNSGNSDHEKWLQLEPGKGRYAVFDRETATGTYVGVWFGSRANATSSFASPVAVLNIQKMAKQAADPALAYVGGKLHLIYIGVENGQQVIWMDALDVSNLAKPRAAGRPVVISRPLKRGQFAHSPVPLHGPDGDVEGIYVANRVGQTSHIYLAADLDPTTPPVAVLEDKSFLNNGGLVGGTFYAANNGGPGGLYARAVRASGAVLLGDREPVGGTLDILAMASRRKPGNILVTALYLSTGTATPFQLPGSFGSFALDLRTTFLLAIVTHDVDGQGSTAIPIPRFAKFKGLRFSVQGLSVETGSPLLLTFTNDAILQVR